MNKYKANLKIFYIISLVMLLTFVETTLKKYPTDDNQQLEVKVAQY